LVQVVLAGTHTLVGTNNQLPIHFFKVRGGAAITADSTGVCLPYSKTDSKQCLPAQAATLRTAEILPMHAFAPFHDQSPYTCRRYSPSPSTHD
jgi:hypothetical protein